MAENTNEGPPDPSKRWFLKKSVALGAAVGLAAVINRLLPGSSNAGDHQQPYESQQKGPLPTTIPTPKPETPPNQPVKLDHIEKT